MEGHGMRTGILDARCSSWYKTEDGRNVDHWPKNVGQYQAELTQVHWGDFIVEGSATTSVQERADGGNDRIRWLWMGLAAVRLMVVTMIMGVRNERAEGVSSAGGV
ncbi:hypothetical protein BO82DRAFT_350625 [Aspergillus uvarum CBS 121591]|uniref:Uncharacterized protein n=1 Tax=Aspergillus uvarum CBS 121591 TaxID=1448315 RepID=A0A319CJL7_9EURO|nr:hypothetical protein BO82DRAFT_350625 [Aspergillus uvarum CBS 121591]PYH85836.1 hypothetical protein BO82DRAFT_350625 [Aspergillus uvarum CBS 121591]